MDAIQILKIVLAVCGLIASAGIGLFLGYWSSSERVLSKELRASILKGMQGRTSSTLDEAVKDIAYIADSQRFSEDDLRDLLRTLGFQTLYLSGTIKSLQYSDLLEWEYRRRVFRANVEVYYMARPVRERYKAEFDARTKHPEPERRDVSQELQSHVSNVQDQQEREYLEETIKCLAVGANRAAIVMSWNLAYHHVRRWVLTKHLMSFNADLTSRHRSKTKTYDPVTNLDDFPDGERFVLEICKSAAIVDNHRYGLLVGALNKRNRCAHPGPVNVTGPEATGFASELLANVVLEPYFT